MAYKDSKTFIENDSFIVDGVGALGRTHAERGLTYYEVALRSFVRQHMFNDHIPLITCFLRVPEYSLVVNSPQHTLNTWAGPTLYIVYIGVSH